MAEDLNSVFLVGRLTRDMELTHTANGYSIGKLSLAVNRRRKVGEQWEDEASFFDLNLWGKRAESLGRYLLKGTQIAVQGQLRQDRWEQDGQRRSRVVVELSNVQLLGSRNSGESHSGAPSYAAHGGGGHVVREGTQGGNYCEGGGYAPRRTASPPAAATEEFEDDIPF